MTKIPCIFSSGALSSGTVLPPLVTRTIRAVSEERLDRFVPFAEIEGPAPGRRRTSGAAARPFYRVGSYRPKVVSEVLGNPKSMEELMKWVNSLDRDRKVPDSGAFIKFLSSRPDVKGKRFGAGYCMAETYISPSGIGLQFLTNLSGQARQIRLAQLLGM